jgi:branched-chain amino acid transport system substrate-binding protein
MIQPFAPPSVAKPGHQPIRDYCQSKGIDLDAKGLHFVQGWYTAHTMVKGIEKTLTDGKELTGPNIKAALETMPPLDTGGVIGPIKFSADSHRGATASSIYAVAGGTFSEIATSVEPKD